MIRDRLEAQVEEKVGVGKEEILICIERRS